MQRGSERRTRQTIQARAADLTGLFSSARLDPGRRGLTAVVVVALLVAIVAGGWVLTSRPRTIPVTATGPGLASESVSAGGTLQSPLPSASGSGSVATVLVVDVAGKVHRPGVYRLTDGARVSDAVAAAGGMLPGVDPVTVNLARKVADGEQIVIGLAPAGGGAPASAGGAGSSAGGADVGSSVAGGSPAGGPAGLVDLNTATIEQLDALPGVGPVLAQRIVDWRTQHGRFDSVDQLNSVSGIGDAKFADLKPLVTV